MTINIHIPASRVESVRHRLERLPWQAWILIPAILASVTATAYFYSRDLLVAYGDAESHLNIAKRVVSSLTPGIAQLGGIWLPLPHLLMLPFVYFDPLWRSGLAGSIVSGICYVITAATLYRLVVFVTGNRSAGIIAAFLFMFNPNILYLQSTAMTELPLILFFTLSGYYFIRYLERQELTMLLLAAAAGFAAALSRYDGWFLIGSEAAVLILSGIMHRTRRQKVEGTVVIFSTLAFFAVFLWLMWDKLILGNALYFMQSEFSAGSQQLVWLHKNMLPSYHNPFLAVAYYAVTSMSDTGIILSALALAGLIMFLSDRRLKNRFLTACILLAPFAFYTVTLYAGQSVIFIPHLTPVGFEWRLFNVRYGTMMILPAAFFMGYLVSRLKPSRIAVVGLLFLLQTGLYAVGYSNVISLEDGKSGLSAGKRPDAEQFLKKHYDGGLVLMDDYARITSIIRSGIPMQDCIYIGNHPYWEESLMMPEKYARWIVMQRNDALWKALYAPADMQGRLYKYFQKVYTSPEILIFRRNPDSAGLSLKE